MMEALTVCPAENAILHNRISIQELRAAKTKPKSTWQSRCCLSRGTRFTRKCAEMHSGFEIDGKMLASWEEIEDLADGVYSLVELEDLYERRQTDEKS